MDGGAWQATVHGVAKSRPRLSDFTFPFHFHTLEKEMATHSSVLARRIPGTGKPGGLPSMGLHRVGHDWSDLAAAALGTVDPFSFPLVWDFNSLKKKIWWKGFFDTLPWSILNILSFLRKFSAVLTEISFLHLRPFCHIFKVNIGKKFFSPYIQLSAK